MAAGLTRLKPFIAKVVDCQSLTEREASDAFEIIMSGEATPAQMGAFLMALRCRGETIDEITGAARIMRSKALTLAAPDNAMDCCGTGGDAAGTFNISTAVSFVLAGLGVPIAKHGNRALSSKTGAADVLTALGVNIDADFRLIEQSLREANLCFLFAVRHHGAMRHVGPTRVELGTRTLFNLLGPLSNPAMARYQLMGVFDERWVEPLASVLGNLGTRRAWVVHGRDGLDEITTTTTTAVAELVDGEVRTFSISPEDVGLPVAHPDDLKGGEPEENASAIRELLAGKRGPYRDIVLLNAAAALIVSEKTTNLREGVALAAAAIDDGRASTILDTIVAVTNRPPPPDPEAGERAFETARKAGNAA
jgi:anthranilate phosphoribosyltransferase